MEQKMYSVEVAENCNEFAIAYSKEHAIIVIVESHIELGTCDYPSDYKKENVKEISKKEMKNIIIEYNYITHELKLNTLYNIFKDLTKYKDGELDFYGAVGDDYICYE